MSLQVAAERYIRGRVEFNGKKPDGWVRISLLGRRHQKTLEITHGPKDDIRNRELIPFTPGAPTIWYVGGYAGDHEAFRTSVSNAFTQERQQQPNIITTVWKTALQLGDSGVLGKITGTAKEGNPVILVVNDANTYGPKYGEHPSGKEVRERIEQMLEASGISKERVHVIGLTTWEAGRFVDSPDLFFNVYRRDYYPEQVTKKIIELATGRFIPSDSQEVTLQGEH